MILWGLFFGVGIGGGFFFYVLVLKYFPSMENSKAVKFHGSLNLTHDINARIKI